MPSTPKSRGSLGGLHGAPRTTAIAPMSERQQMALVMQMTSQNNPSSNVCEERRKNRQQRNVRGETPLHVAAIKGDHELVKKLLDQGQDPDESDFAGWTPLHEACNYGWYPVVAVLVKAGANVNAKGLNDDTPLHDAATTGNLKVIKFLIENGADPTLKNMKGQTPSEFASHQIYNYFQSLKDTNTRASHTGRARDDNSKKGNACTTSSTEGSKRNNMEGLAQANESYNKDNAASSSSDKNTATTSDNKDDSHPQLSCSVVSSSQDDTSTSNHKRPYFDNDSTEAESVEDEASKRKKRKEEADKESMPKPAPVSRGTAGRIMTGTKPPGPASKTGAIPLSKQNASQNSAKSSTGPPGKSNLAGPKGSGSGASGAKNVSNQNVHQGKSVNAGKGASGSQIGKPDRKSPVASPKPNTNKDSGDGDSEDTKSHELAPKVPPLKIVIPSSSSGRRGGEGGSGRRGSGKGRNSLSTLPYVIPCTSSDMQSNDGSEGSDDKKDGKDGKSGQRVLRSHRTVDGEKEKDRISPQSNTQSAAVGSTSSSSALNSTKSPPPSTSHSGSSSQDTEHGSSSSSNTGGSGRGESGNNWNASGGHGGSHSSSHGAGHGSSVELHPRKRKIKAAKDNHSHREQSKSSSDSNSTETSSHGQHLHSNPYQMYLHIKKQIEERQRALFPVKPKPPKDFNKYLMNRRTYTLQKNVNPDPPVDYPTTLPAQMKEEFAAQEKDRHILRIQHLVEKEKLVLAVEQEILRVHGRAERAAANQALPYSVCTILRNKEVYNVLPPPEPEEKKNAQRSRFTIRQINSWLQEVDDKWEKIKEGVLQRQNTEAETLHAVQKMDWEWKLKELGLCDYKITPTIDPLHVPQIHGLYTVQSESLEEETPQLQKCHMTPCSYTLQKNVNPDPPVDYPTTLPAQMKEEFANQEKDRRILRIQHLIEKEKLVLAEQQENLRERAASNQVVPNLVCDFGLEGDEKWCKIREGVLQRQNTEAETLHAVQKLDWEWKLKELGLCDYKITPTIDPLHVPLVHVPIFS